MKRLTREQAIGQVGIEAVEEVDVENLEPTGRVGFNGSCQGDDLTEWSASVTVNDSVLIAYCYTNREQDNMISDGDASLIDWTTDHYEIV